MEALRFLDWERAVVPDGILMCHPRGVSHGVVRIRRNQQRRSMARIVADAIARSPGPWRPVSCNGVEPLITTAGEHGALAVLRSDAGQGRYFDRYLAVVVGASAMVRLEGFCEQPANAHEFVRDFKDLATRCTTGDSPNRRRMFEYRAPSGWNAVRRPLSTTWYAPGYPRQQGSFEVFDAIPVSTYAARLTHDLMAGTPAGACEAVSIPGDLHGTRRTTENNTTVCLDGERFGYEVRYHHPEGAASHRLAFESLLHSIKRVPLPRGVALTAATPEAFAWAL